METKKCLECEKSFYGRVDKKFCSDACRSNFNNKTQHETEILITKVNKVLRKNRRILKNLNPSGSSTVKKEVLDSLGFNFKYFTNAYTSKNGTIYTFCYDHGYKVLEDSDKVFLINYQPYMKS